MKLIEVKLQPKSDNFHQKIKKNKTFFHIFKLNILFYYHRSS